MHELLLFVMFIPFLLTTIKLLKRNFEFKSHGYKLMFLHGGILLSVMLFGLGSLIFFYLRMSIFLLSIKNTLYVQVNFKVWVRNSFGIRISLPLVWRDLFIYSCDDGPYSVWLISWGSTGFKCCLIMIWRLLFCNDIEKSLLM